MTYAARKPAIALAAGLLAIAALTLQPDGAAAGGGEPDRICGKRPGTGAFNYFKVWNTSCKKARKIDRRATRKFCGGNGPCDVDEGEVVIGQARVRGWSCKLRVGFESFRNRCVKGDKRFIHKSGA
jgi:hypothetical protein